MANTNSTNFQIIMLDNDKDKEETMNTFFTLLSLNLQGIFLHCTETPDCADLPLLTETLECADPLLLTKTSECADLPLLTETPECADPPLPTETPDCADPPQPTETPSVPIRHCLWKHPSVPVCRVYHAAKTLHRHISDNTLQLYKQNSRGLKGGRGTSAPSGSTSSCERV